MSLDFFKVILVILCDVNREKMGLVGSINVVFCRSDQFKSDFSTVKATRQL
jgi:hypothetical protein